MNVQKNKVKFLYDEFKCNLKELTTKSAWVPRTAVFGMRMPGCAVVPVMGALFQSRGWLPIVEAPGYFRHPTSILAMQLLMNILDKKCSLRTLEMVFQGIWGECPQPPSL